MKRLEHNSNNLEEVERYFSVRAVQLKESGFSLDSMEEITGIGVRAYFLDKNGEKHQSLYIYETARGRGEYLKNLIKDIPVVTTDDCQIVDFLEKKKIKHCVSGEIFESKEYKLILDYYGDKKSNRSQVFLMNHIDEGVAILGEIGSTDLAKRAFMVHPLHQTDLRKVYEENISVEERVLILSMEYRYIANSYLSRRKINDIQEIILSPLKEVNEMLIADKIQNYKDFCLYHKDTHPRSKDLDEYFQNWFKCLKLDSKEVSRLIHFIS